MARKDANPGAKEAAAARRAAAIEYRKAGMTVRAIAEKLGVSAASIHADIAKALKEVNEKTLDEAKELQALQWERLDMFLLALYPQVRKGDTSAIAQGVNIIKAQNELKGLNEPKKVAPLAIDPGAGSDEGDDESGLGVEERVRRVLVVLETGRARRGSAPPEGD